tara:strand:- start:975 stop:1196 length:222 start_codon:yes stop_codon:yes gene_type:complete
MASRKSNELIILESLEKKLSELIKNIDTYAEEEPLIDLNEEGQGLDRVQLSQEAFEEIESYCENKNNLVIGIS